jgi:hypothetical protein
MDMEQLNKINHVVVLMLENRFFDSMLHSSDFRRHGPLSALANGAEHRMLPNDGR